MKKLHPRAVWSFFLSKTISIVVLASFWAFFGLVITGSIGEDVKGFSSMEFVSLSMFVLIFAILITISYIIARLTYHYYRYELTDDSYRAERGIIRKRYVSIPYERIQNVDIYRGLIDRLLGLSVLQIQTAGYGAVGAAAKFGSEGRLPGLSHEDAKQLRDELIRRTKKLGNQGL